MPDDGQLNALQARVASLQAEVDRLPKADHGGQLAGITAQLQGLQSELATAQSFIRGLHGSGGVIVNGNTIGLDGAIWNSLTNRSGGETSGTDVAISGCLNGAPAYVVVPATSGPTLF